MLKDTKEKENEEKIFLKISVMVSGGGTNLQAIIDGIESGFIKYGKIVQVISSNENAFALERAKKHNIKAVVIDSEEDGSGKNQTQKIIEALDNEKTDLVVLAGYMSIIEAPLIDKYGGRIINIHPSLIPKFCGKGFYGKRVHRAVLQAGEKESGATVHFVDKGVDTGPIILQKKVPVLAGDDEEKLAARVLVTEHEILKTVIKLSAEQFYRSQTTEIKIGAAENIGGI